VNQALNHKPVDPNDWATPVAFFKHAEERLGCTFGLDVCATPENAKCARFYDLSRDGLAAPWDEENVWCNPPYGHGCVEKWLAKGVSEIRASNITGRLVYLIPASTDTQWFHKYVLLANRIWLVEGRLRFTSPDGKNGNASFPSMLVEYDVSRHSLGGGLSIETIAAVREHSVGVRNTKQFKAQGLLALEAI
jgi:site-specific DNA-methyltransferase (adenine-specific)